MKVLVNIYHDVKTEARTQDLLKIMKEIGETEFLSFSYNDVVPGVPTVLTGGGKRSYWTFIRDSVIHIFKSKPDVLVLHDNYTSAILLIVRLFLKNKPFIIYDSSEIYFDKKGKNLRGKIVYQMQALENRNIQYADLVIAANEERAELMKKLFGLRETPMVIDNIHRIEDSYDEEYCREKFESVLRGNQFTVLYAGGISRERKTFELADAVRNVDNKTRLIVVGAGRKETIEEFEEYISEINCADRITYLGFITRAELKYLLEKSDVSVSLFEQNCYNNTYCASGKVYESLFEETPILTSMNPPLKNLCDTYHVGVSTEDLQEGLVTLKTNYEDYKNAVTTYAKVLKSQDRIGNYVHIIQERLAQHSD